MPMAMAGALRRHRLMPDMRMEVSSLSEARRPYTRRTAVRNPHGMENISEKGMTWKMNSRTMLMGALFSTRRGRSSLNRLPRRSRALRAITPRAVTPSS